MTRNIPQTTVTPDQPFLETVYYGSRKGDFVTDAIEGCAVTNHVFESNGESIPYTARAGHLVAADLHSGQPAAKIFYVAFCVNAEPGKSRPITFFYNGGPGASSIYLLLGSFGPRRIRTSTPNFTPPAPYVLEHNKECLLDSTDLVFINPVGTGYSAAISPNTNRDFWGVDEDARCIKQFIKRYLTVYGRWNSPKFLFGESYGTPRTCVLSWMLHEDGVDLNGIILQSSVLDYGQVGNPIGLLPTLAANALYHEKATVNPVPSDLSSFLASVESFAKGPFADALPKYPVVDAALLKRLSDILGIPPIVLKYWKLDPSAGGGSVFLTSLMQEEGYAIGAYDGRFEADEMGIAGSIDPASGNNDPTMTAIGGVYTTMWNVYLNEELQFISLSPFLDSNDEAFKNWDFAHIDPTGAQKGGAASLYTAGDLAAALALNPNLRVFAANGYYDAVTPFFQTKRNFEGMPLSGPHSKSRITTRNYPSGHMIYLDNASRAAMKADLVEFYNAPPVQVAAAEFRSRPREELLTRRRYRRRIDRSPY